MSITDIRGLLRYAIESQARLVDLMKSIDEKIAVATKAMQAAIEAKRSPLTASQQSGVQESLGAFSKVVGEIRFLTAAGTAARDLAYSSIQRLQQALRGSQNPAAGMSVEAAQDQLHELDVLLQLSEKMIADVEGYTGFVSEGQMSEAVTDAVNMVDCVVNMNRNAVTLLNHINTYLSSIGAEPLDFTPGHGNGSNGIL